MRREHLVRAARIGFVLIVALGSAAAGLLLPSSLMPLPVRVIVAVGALVALALLPWLLRLGGRLARRLPALRAEVLQTRPLYESVALYLGNAALKSFGF